MSDLENANSVFDISVKLCSAIEKHKCLYDRNSVRKNSTPECEKAWQVVAKECNQTVDYCRNRWKNLLRAFYQGVNRRGNPYYLHDYMSFLLEDEKKTKSKRQPEAALNDETNSTITHDEIVNVDDDAADESDSNTNSADESNEKLDGNKSQRGGSGVFIVDEIGEEAGEGENRERRLSYKRSCKRGLDPELLGELGDEDSQEPESKRTRKVVKEGGKRSEDNDLELLPNKKVVVRIDKIKINKPFSDNKSAQELEEMRSKMIKDTMNSSERFFVEKKTSTPKPIKMVDCGTFTAVATRCIGTQYEASIDFLDYDEIFMQSIKQRLQEMNARQKMNFKAKIYQSLLEVFDDTADFPGTNEVLKFPHKKPQVVNTTTGELRLMRELVSLVQAAKNTPEIINAKEKIKTNTAFTTAAQPVQAPTASKPSIKLPMPNNADNSSKAQISPLSLSPSLDDDDFQFSLDNIDDDDDIDLPRTWEEIKAKPSETAKTTATATPTVEENVMGLPRRILQKVVRVSGPSGSTIVARDGDKKRIYRIYPKAMNPNHNITSSIANKNTNMGTFYVTPAKGPGETVVVPNTNKNQITVRSFNTNNNTKSPVTTSNADVTTSANSNNQSSVTNLGNQTAFKNVHPANRILSSTTGLFKTVASPKPLTNTINQKPTNVQTISNFQSSTVTKVSAVAKNPMLPPTSANLAAKRQIVRSHINAPQMMQRRYSICGPLPVEKTQNTPTTTTGSPITSKGSNALNNLPQTQSSTSSSLSQIQISQPISLNTSAAPSTRTQKISHIQALPTPNVGDYSTPVADIKISFKESAGNKPKTPTEEIPILETAGTVGVDVLDPLFVKQSHIKSEPSDD
ncbi:mucin-5AC [Lucilia cuprina]|uniref:mucin-5AC n=1 Tax=Lucilia cuprina TaxID=7375 RepID=UPI001F070B0E|nr:mucin-5AC [Lucilia cuprina]